MIQDLLDNEFWKTIREMTPILLIILILMTLGVGYWAKSNSDELGSQQAQINANTAAQIQQARIFDTFLKAFDAENNYECSIAEYIAQMNHLPLPPSGTCRVVAP